MVRVVREALTPLVSRGGNARAGASCFSVFVRTQLVSAWAHPLEGSQQAGAGDHLEAGLCVRKQQFRV